MKKIIYPPRITLLTGVPGSGKTSLSIGYASDGYSYPGVLDFIDAGYIEKDRIKWELSPERKAKIDPNIRTKVYDEVFKRAESLLRAERSVWIDASFADEVKDPSWGDRYIRLAQKYGTIPVFLRTVLPENELRKRLEKRNDPIDRDKLENWEQFLSQEPIHVPIPNDGMEIDTNEPHYKNIGLVTETLQGVTSPSGRGAPPSRAWWPLA